MKHNIFKAVLLLIALSANGAIITVDRADDLMAGGDGGCDLRDAINSANLNFGLEGCTAGTDNAIDIILLNVNQPIQLQSDIELFGSAWITRHANVDSVEIIAGTNHRHFVVNMPDSNDDDFAISGIRLTGGNQSNPGGSILMEEAGTVEIFDNVFENNQASDGGAIYADGSVVSDFLIAENQFINNRAIDTGGSSAGGAVWGKNITVGVLQIVDNLFENNLADFGGATYLDETNDTITLSKNRFYYNHANTSGGAMFFSSLTGGQSYQVEKSVYLNNTAVERGGAIYASSLGGTQVDVVNSTFGMNHANLGGALAAGGSTIRVLGSTLAHNSALTSGSQAYTSNGGLVSFGKSIVAYSVGQTNCAGENFGSMMDNIDDDGSCGLPANEGNLVADPMLSGLSEFANINPLLPDFLPAFQLSADSPAIDYEDDSFCWVPPGIDLNEDQNGLSRDIDGDGVGAATCDLGALEAGENNDLIYNDSFGI